MKGRRIDTSQLAQEITAVFLINRCANLTEYVKNFRQKGIGIEYLNIFGTLLEYEREAHVNIARK